MPASGARAGSPEEGEFLLRPVLKTALRNGFRLDAVLIMIDLLEVVANQGRAAEALYMGEEFLPVLRQWGLHTDFLAVLVQWTEQAGAFLRVGARP